MKKSSKPTIFLLITLLLIVTVFALVSIGLKLKYEQLVLQKSKNEKTLSTLNQIADKLRADQESFSSESIISIAQSQLGLVRNLEPAFIIKYDNNKVEELNETLKEKYE